jgi:hypothetical protein
LFTIGKSVIGLYIGSSNAASSYGTAGAYLVILIWVYYSAQISARRRVHARAYAERLGSHAAERQIDLRRNAAFPRKPICTCRRLEYRRRELDSLLSNRVKKRRGTESYRRLFTGGIGFSRAVNHDHGFVMAGKRRPLLRKVAAGDA